MKYLVLTLCLLLACTQVRGATVSDASDPGRLRFAIRSGSDWNSCCTDNPTAATKAFMQSHYWRFQTTPGYFDKDLSWFPNAWGYIDSYAIYASQSLKDQHPEWILKDSSGRELFIPWGCSNGTCPQYAADISNAAYRAYWISKASAIIAAGYKGLWIDDVNLIMQVGDGQGSLVTPMDANTGKPMSSANWEKYFADFMTQVRAALPNTEILHNSMWYAGTGLPGSDPYVQQEIKAADYINREHGVMDSGIIGDDSYWSIRSLFRFFDIVHSLGRHIDLQETSLAGTYSVAAYFLVSNGNDAFGSAVYPSQWQSPLYDLSLGSPQGDRYDWDGVIRRDYSGGSVFLLPPGKSGVNLNVGTGYTDLSGASVSALTLNAKQGAILLRPAPVVVPPPPPPPPVLPPPPVVAPPAPSGGGLALVAIPHLIKNLYSGMALDDPGAATSTGTQIVQWEPNGGLNQQWRFLADGSGNYMIQNVSSGLVLTDVAGELEQVWYGASQAKHWSVIPVSGGYVIKNVATGHVIDDAEMSKSDGNGMIVWAPNGGPNQVWVIQ